MQLAERISMRCPSCDFTDRDGCEACNHHGYLVWDQGRLTAPETPHASDVRAEGRKQP